jgi:hypothetical protein
MEDVSSAQGICLLEIRRRQDLLIDHETSDGRCVTFQNAHHCSRELGARLGPRTAMGELVGGVLHADRHDLRSRRRKGRIVKGRESNVEEGFS